MPSSRPTPVHNPAVVSALNAKAVDALIVEGRKRIVTAVTHGIERLRGEYESKLLEVTARAEAERSEMARRLEAAENSAELLARRITDLKEQIERKPPESSAPGPPDGSPPSSGPSKSLRRSGPRTKPDGPPVRLSVPVGSKPPDLGLAAWLSAHEIEIIDKRDRVDGSLWVVGPRSEVKPVIDGLRKQGIMFTYVAAGSRATANRPGWFTKHAH